MTASTTSPEVFGPYLVYERLGAGGMATVHRAIKTGIEGFQRPVALKRLLSQHAGDQEFVRGFVREARLASRLTHPNIAQTYDLGRVDATYYIAMELVDGTDLRNVLRHAAYSVGPVPVPLVLSLLTQICDALDYAHSFTDETGRPLGIVHRDVSPANLIVGRDGTVKIIDFGIAKASSATLYTATGILKGKFSYMAPESLDGKTDARSDLFAVGVVAYELLTARPLFKGATDFDTLEQVKRHEVPPPSTINPSVPPEVDQVVLTALAKNPTQRWQSAGHMRSAVASLAERFALRSTTQDLPRWIEWALAQPIRPQAWDDAGRGMAAEDDHSMVIEVDPATQIGAAPMPMRPPTEASRLRTLMADGGQPIVGYAQQAQQPQPYAQAQPQPQPHAPAPSPMAGKPTMMAWGDQPQPSYPQPPQHGYPGQSGSDQSTMMVQPFYGQPVAPVPHVAAHASSPSAVAAQTMANPLASPEYMAAAAAFNASEERRHMMEAVVSLPAAAPVTALPRKNSALWFVVVLVLCVGAAVGGFFLVNALI